MQELPKVDRSLKLREVLMEIYSEVSTVHSCSAYSVDSEVFLSVQCWLVEKNLYPGARMRRAGVYPEPQLA